MEIRQRLGLTFWKRWVIATIAGFFAGSVVAWVSGYLGSFLFGELLLRVGLCSRDQGALFCVLLGAVLGGGIGLGASVGVAQWVLLRRMIHRAHWWVLTSVLGWLGVGVALVWLSYSSQISPVVMPDGSVVSVALAERLAQTLPAILWAIAAGGLMGLFQGLVLRSMTHRWGWWVILHMGLLLLAAVGIFFWLQGTGGLVGLLGFFVTASPIYAIATGKVLVWMTSRSINSA